ncbi:uncharacterized protein LOC132032714 [Lycium ferocissimum]|uniref:uncharacterized protein LOC132032714 n=1 Tax=Lycium ferocissimum TaxID=112874 RepID=UPI0028166886|nr:uncharacterized protein LOC132032714 [Lycium ferocissimum]XP_059278398.1 uncharacterized protein LOC132032714 [Lycium ferocissimum]
MPKHSIGHANLGGSSNISHQCVEDLEKHVETLEEKLTGYEEMKETLEDTKEQLVETKERLAQNENHLATLHRFLQAKFGCFCDRPLDQIPASVWLFILLEFLSLIATYGSPSV